MKIKNTCFIFFLLLLSCLLVSFGQPHSSLWCSLIASSFGLALFFLPLFTFKKRKERFFLATFWFTAVQLVQLFWLCSPEYQGWYIVFVYLGLSLALGLQFGLFSLCFPLILPLNISRLLFLSAIWTLLEWSRLFVFCGFVWNPIGLSLAATAVTAQMTTAVGVFGLSFWVMLVNLVAVNVFYRFRLQSVSLWLCSALVPYLFGQSHLYYHQGKQESKEKRNIQVALVQPALFPDERDPWHDRMERFVPPFEQWQRIILYLESSLKKGDRRADLIVLPEAAVCFDAYVAVYSYQDVLTICRKIWNRHSIDLDYLKKEPLGKKFFFEGEERWFVTNAFWAQVIADHYDAEVIIGLSDREEQTGENYNAAFHFSPKVVSIKRYEKQVLLPLAEYIPLSFLRPLVARYGIRELYTSGTEAKVFGTRCPLSISICYEECFGHLIREGKKKGAELFVNVTNDGWYPNSLLPQQHFFHGYLRALENGIPLVRACNTGVTIAVDSLGRVVNALDSPFHRVKQKSGVLFLSLPLYTYSTLYTIWGDGLIVAVAIFFLLFPLFLGRNKEHSKSFLMKIKNQFKVKRK